MERHHIIFKGRVQGVGFRFTARSYAKKYGLTGWIKNLSSGEVETVVEGKEPDLNSFLKSLREHFKGYILSFTRETLPASNEFSGFRIEFF